MKYSGKTWARTTLGAILGGLLAFGLVGSAWAADFRSGEYVVIKADEVINDDLFITGQRVEVEGTVRGDLFVTGDEVVVNGTVEGSLVMGGQTLTVNGQVNGSVYGGGYSMTVGRTAEIGRNLYFGGFSLNAEKDSAVGRSIYASGYQVMLNGDVANDVTSNSAALELNGSVGGDVTGEVSEQGESPLFMPNFPGSVPMVAPGLRVGDSAEIGGEVNVDIVQAGAEVDVGASFASWMWRTLRERLGEFIALLIVGGLLLWFWPNLVQRASTEAGARVLPNAGRGCLITLIFPIALVVAVMVLIIVALLIGLVTLGQLSNDILSIGGASLALIAVVFSFVFSTVTIAVVAFLSGRMILSRVIKQMKPGWLTNFIYLALGALIYEILRVIPILGWLLSVVVILIGLGAIYMVLRQMMQPATSPPDLPGPSEPPTPFEPLEPPSVSEPVM
ncbi:MAG: hypothetical protein JXM69_04295 [Anaerolineae bacterium]|nr:hypothetical protein [Anaerolineae bacterium]